MAKLKLHESEGKGSGDNSSSYGVSSSKKMEDVGEATARAQTLGHAMRARPTPVVGRPPSVTSASAATRTTIGPGTATASPKVRPT
jgi:hypothetical protein